MIVPVFVNHTLYPPRLPRFLQKHTDLPNTESYLFFSFYNESNRINILCTSCGYYVHPCSPDDSDSVKQVLATVGFRVQSSSTMPGCSDRNERINSLLLKVWYGWNPLASFLSVPTCPQGHLSLLPPKSLLLCTTYLPQAVFCLF